MFYDIKSGLIKDIMSMPVALFGPKMSQPTFANETVTFYVAGPNTNIKEGEESKT